MLSRFVFRIMPWWLYGLIALGLLPVFFMLVSQHLTLREDVALARQTPPELQVMREEGRLPGLDAPLAEFHVRARLLGQGFMGEGKTERPGR